MVGEYGEYDSWEGNEVGSSEVGGAEWMVEMQIRVVINRSRNLVSLSCSR